MKKNLLLTSLVLLVPSFAPAHVSVRPRESKQGVEERYTVRVPTEGAVATTDPVLEIPADVTVLEVLPAEGATVEATKQGDRITSITWKKAIPPKAAAEFVFRAKSCGGRDRLEGASAFQRRDSRGLGRCCGRQAAGIRHKTECPIGCPQTIRGGRGHRDLAERL
jgi:hypothetical protein